MTTPRILVITGWSWKDPLIQVYTLPYVRILRDELPAGTKILLATMEQPALKPEPGEAQQIRKQLSEEGITLLMLPYRSFGLAGLLTWILNFFVLCRAVLVHRITVLHAWCMPAGALACFLAWVFRRRLVIDSYEPHAEAMVENKTWQQNSFRFRLLFALEKKITRRADVVIAATEAMKTYAREKYGWVPRSFFVKPACVNLTFFNSFAPKEPALVERYGLAGKVIGLYVGKFGGIYLTSEVFDFFKAADDHWGSQFHLLLLTGHDEGQLKEWASASGLDWKKITCLRVAPGDMPRYVGLADFAITPVKPVPTKRYCTPIKDGEYWAMGLPVVITEGISDDSGLIAQHGAGYVLDALTRQQYEAAVKKIDFLISPENRMATHRNVLALARNYRDLEQARPLYRSVYATLFPAPASPSPLPG